MSGCCPSGVGVQGPQGPGQPVDDAVPGPRPPAVHDAARPAVVRGLGPLAARGEAHVLAPAARRVRPAHRETPLFQQAHRQADRLPGHPSQARHVRQCDTVRAEDPQRIGADREGQRRVALELGAEAHQRPRKQGGQPGAGHRGARPRRQAGSGPSRLDGPRTPAGRRATRRLPAPPPSAAPRLAGRSRPRRTGPASAPRSRRPAARRCPGPGGPTGWAGRSRPGGAGTAGCRPGPGPTRTYPHRSSPGRLVSGTRSATSRSGTPSGGRNRRKFAHMLSDTSHGPRPSRAGPQVVRCGSCRSDSLSNSIVNATRACDSSAESPSSATRTAAR